MKLSIRRAEMLSLAALLLHTLFFFLLFWILQSCQSLALEIEAWHCLGGVLVWLILLLQFRQRRLAEEERLDVEHFERLRREGKDTSVFEGTAAEGVMHLAQRRLAWLEKWLVPAFAVLNSIYLLVMGYWLLQRLMGAEQSLTNQTEPLLVSAAYLSGMVLVSFLFSRYAIGMSQQPAWRPLRAGGSYLFSNALACLALALLLLAATAGYAGLLAIAGWVLVALMLGIGIEFILNLILDAYRPRIKNQYRRAPYESRLLGLFCEPGGLLKTAAHAIDYQFGFKVSDTWFYKLLERAVAPLLVAQVLILYFMTCVTIVPSGHQGLVERWGVPRNLAQPWGSGLHLKLPYPIEIVRNYPTEQIQTFEIGFERKDQEDYRPILWTVEHWKKEDPFLVAVEPANFRMASEVQDQKLRQEATQAQAAKADPWVVDLLVVAMVVNYRISDLPMYAYGSKTLDFTNSPESRKFGYTDPQELLKAICYRQVTQFAARNSMEKLMGPGWDETTRRLRQTIQQETDQRGLGVKIEFVGLQSVHPPRVVAEAFEKVVGAMQQKQAQVLHAQSMALAELAQARGLEQVQVKGAEADRFSRVEQAKADAARFAHQVQAFKDGGNVYLWREYLSMLEETYPALRKYIIASDRVTRSVFQFDLKEKLQPDFEDAIKQDQ